MRVSEVFCAFLAEFRAIPEEDLVKVQGAKVQTPEEVAAYYESVFAAYVAVVGDKELTQFDTLEEAVRDLTRYLIRGKLDQLEKMGVHVVEVNPN